MVHVPGVRCVWGRRRGRYRACGIAIGGVGVAAEWGRGKKFNSCKTESEAALLTRFSCIALYLTVSDEHEDCSLPCTGADIAYTEPSRGGLSISSQSRYLPEHGVRPAAACLVHPFGVAAAVAALQQRVGFVTHVGGEHLGWPNAGTLRSQRVGRRRASSLGLHCAALRGAPHAARAHRLSSGAHKAIGVRAPSRRRGMLSPLSGAWRPRGGLGGQPCAWAASHAP